MNISETFYCNILLDPKLSDPYFKEKGIFGGIEMGRRGSMSSESRIRLWTAPDFILWSTFSPSINYRRLIAYPEL